MVEIVSSRFPFNEYQRAIPTQTFAELDMVSAMEMGYILTLKLVKNKVHGQKPSRVTWLLLLFIMKRTLFAMQEKDAVQPSIHAATKV